MSLIKDSSVNPDPESLSKHELICQVKKLEANVRQLRSIIKKRQLTSGSSSLDTSGNNDCESPVAQKMRKSRDFDFTRYRKRHIVLKFLYLGWDYQGFVVQEDTNQTIEDHLFRALVKTRLIQDRATSNYHRCGRTDKGVSAFSQVVSIDVRSKMTKGVGIVDDSDELSSFENLPENQVDDESLEIDYCGILNKVLPDEIRCISWAPVRPGFSARFDCKGRCYYYYFPASSLDIVKMKLAGQHLVGTHDFTNFCKKDTSRKEINNIRTIQSFDLFPASNQPDHHSPYSIYIIRIAASGFLWHQIRCIMAILFLIGEGREDVTLVKQLLDVKTVTNKPQYMLAYDLPLILFTTHWDSNDIGTWNYSVTTITELVKHLQTLWTRQAIKCSMIRSMIDNLTCNYLPSNTQINFQHGVLVNETSTKSYKPILDRPRCGNSDENRKI